MDTYGIENVNFSLIDNGDDKWEDYKKQREERGFDDSETWSLDYTIASFILPRLKRFKEIKRGFPSLLSSVEEWDEILDKIITAFELIVDTLEIDTKTLEKISEGLNLFAKWYTSLWW